MQASLLGAMLATARVSAHSRRFSLIAQVQRSATKKNINIKKLLKKKKTCLKRFAWPLDRAGGNTRVFKSAAVAH